MATFETKAENILSHAKTVRFLIPDDLEKGPCSMVLVFEDNHEAFRVLYNEMTTDNNERYRCEIMKLNGLLFLTLIDVENNESINIEPLKYINTEFDKMLGLNPAKFILIFGLDAGNWSFNIIAEENGFIPLLIGGINLNSGNDEANVFGWKNVSILDDNINNGEKAFIMVCKTQCQSSFLADLLNSRKHTLFVTKNEGSYVFELELKGENFMLGLDTKMARVDYPRLVHIEHLKRISAGYRQSDTVVRFVPSIPINLVIQ